jgi:hypothetical protein
MVLETAVHEATLHRLGKFGQPDGSNTKVNEIFSAIYFLLTTNTYNLVGTNAADDSWTNTEGSVDHASWPSQGRLDRRGEAWYDGIAGSQ